MLPIFEGHPRGWVNPVNARASAALPAAGAWDATPTEFFVSGAHFATLNFSYTRGAAGGAFDWQLETSIYSVAANAKNEHETALLFAQKHQAQFAGKADIGYWIVGPVEARA